MIIRLKSSMLIFITRVDFGFGCCWKKETYLIQQHPSRMGDRDYYTLIFN